MPDMDINWAVGTYTDDFGNTYSNLNFKFEKNNNMGANPNSLVGATDYIARTNNINCSSSIFKMRKAKILWNDGSSTELPIPSLADVNDYITNLKGLAGKACVSLIGEHWANVPPAKLGITFSDFASTAIAGAIKPPKQSIQFRYRLDGQTAGNTDGPIVKKSFLTLPEVIYNAQTDCIDQLPNNFNCTPTEGLDLRKFIGKRIKTDGQSIARQVYVGVGSPASIKECGATVAEFFNCLAYDGTSMDNAELFY